MVFLPPSADTKGDSGLEGNRSQPLGLLTLPIPHDLHRMLVAALLGAGAIRTSNDLADEVTGTAGEATTWAALVEDFGTLHSASPRSPRVVGAFFRVLIREGYLTADVLLPPAAYTGPPDGEELTHLERRFKTKASMRVVKGERRDEP